MGSDKHVSIVMPQDGEFLSPVDFLHDSGILIRGGFDLLPVTGLLNFERRSLTEIIMEFMILHHNLKPMSQEMILPILDQTI